MSSCVWSVVHECKSNLAIAKIKSYLILSDVLFLSLFYSPLPPASVPYV